MTECVVDASVAVKWVVDEAFSDRAAKLLDGRKLLAPAHWLGESVNALWGYTLRGDIDASQASMGAAVLARAPVVAVPLPELTRDALALSLAHSVTVYDALYLALARQRRVTFVTDDRKLIRKLAGEAAFSNMLVWVADIT